MADEEADAKGPMRLMLLGYGGDLASVPQERVWRTQLDLISATGVLPFMEHVLASLSVVEDSATPLNNAASYVSAATTFGIDTIPKLVEGLSRWAETRRRVAAQRGSDS